MLHFGTVIISDYWLHQKNYSNNDTYYLTVLFVGSNDFLATAHYSLEILICNVSQSITFKHDYNQYSVLTNTENIYI